MQLNCIRECNVLQSLIAHIYMEIGRFVLQTFFFTFITLEATLKSCGDIFACAYRINFLPFYISSGVLWHSVASTNEYSTSQKHTVSYLILENKLYYSKSCSVGNLCHEIIHALGLHHEHTREDRDNYITVEWNNIMAGRKNDFKKKHGNTLNLPYDLKSIMHYGQYFFSKDGSPTVLPKQNEAQMGQRRHLSELDIQKLNKLYHCGIPLFPYCVTCRFHITLLINRTN
uniref:Metalloendopeptidase n=1 Tax=Mola mola TaxID=94237 RepID=A0A3Q3XDK3_MOLML